MLTGQCVWFAIYAQVIAQTSAANMCVEECASDLAELPVHVEERAIDYVVIYQMEKVITKGHYSVKPGNTRFYHFFTIFTRENW